MNREDTFWRYEITNKHRREWQLATTPVCLNMTSPLSLQSAYILSYINLFEQISSDIRWSIRADRTIYFQRTHVFQKFYFNPLLLLISYFPKSIKGHIGNNWFCCYECIPSNQELLLSFFLLYWNCIQDYKDIQCLCTLTIYYHTELQHLVMSTHWVQPDHLMDSLI